MDRDAFGAGVEPGGLHSRHEIKILICYVLIAAGVPMPRNDVLDVICGNGMANFFDTSAAIDELVELGNLREREDDTLLVTETGSRAAETLADLLPYTIRERASKTAVQLLARRRNEQENHVNVVKTEAGYTVTCTVGSEQSPLLSFSLLVADDRQAALVRERFLEDPLLLYQSVIAVLTGDARFESTDRIIIDLK